MKSQQKLIDITFEIALTLHRNREWAKGKSNEEIATWVAEQLRECGFDTQPVGSSWGALRGM